MPSRKRPGPGRGAKDSHPARLTGARSRRTPIPVIAWHWRIPFDGKAALDWHGSSHSTTGAERITLHNNSNFRGFVDFLRTELDRVSPAHADLCRDFFSRAVALELSFFEAAYTT